MAVTPPILAAAIIASAPTLRGPSWFQLCAGISVGVVSWAIVPSNVILSGSVNGTIGGGPVTGKFVIPPIPTPIVASVTGVGLVGISAPQIATAVGLGIGNAYSAAGQYIGVSTGAIGTDITKVVFSNPSSLVPVLVASLASQGMVGPAAVQLCSGIAPGVAAMFLTGFGTGVATGASGGIPGVGISKSNVL